MTEKLVHGGGTNCMPTDNKEMFHRIKGVILTGVFFLDYQFFLGRFDMGPISANWYPGKLRHFRTPEKHCLNYLITTTFPQINSSFYLAELYPSAQYQFDFPSIFGGYKAKETSYILLSCNSITGERNVLGQENWDHETRWSAGTSAQTFETNTQSGSAGWFLPEAACWSRSQSILNKNPGWYHEDPIHQKAGSQGWLPVWFFAVPLKKIVRIHTTSGTTGKPTVVGYTQKDLDT